MRHPKKKKVEEIVSDAVKLIKQKKKILNKA